MPFTAADFPIGPLRVRKTRYVDGHPQPRVAAYYNQLVILSPTTCKWQLSDGTWSNYACTFDLATGGFRLDFLAGEIMTGNFTSKVHAINGVQNGTSPSETYTWAVHLDRAKNVTVSGLGVPPTTSAAVVISGKYVFFTFENCYISAELDPLTGRILPGTFHSQGTTPYIGVEGSFSALLKGSGTFTRSIPAPSHGTIFQAPEDAWASAAVD